MRNADLPAHSTLPGKDAAGCTVPGYPGLTNRELFAAMAMQGSIAAILTTKTDAESLGVLSVQAADALLAALEESDE